MGDAEFCFEHKEKKRANISGDSPVGQVLFSWVNFGNLYDRSGRFV